MSKITIWRGQSANLTIGQIQNATKAHISKYVFYSAYTGLTPTRGAYTAALSDVTGTIASGTVVTSVTDAKVPVLATISATGSISGSVATALSTSNVKVGEFANDSASINIGTWALEASETDNGGIAVGKAGSAKVTGAITIVSGTYVTDVTPKTLS